MRYLTPESLLSLTLAGLLFVGPSALWADNPNVYPNTVAATSPDASTPVDADAPQQATLTPDQLDTLVAPIALYPDTLVSQILVATTYPLEIVQAAQWLDQNASLKGQDLTKAAQAQNWDASIQALVVFPDVIKRLSQDVTWTTNLGNAFLAHQGDVMDAVQRMRGKAEDSGKLKSTEQQKVTTTTDQGQKVIEIEPANPEIVYVPYYDPTLIWGPPAYYSYPEWDYSGRPYGGASFWFGSGVSLGFYYGSAWRPSYGWGWHPYWHDRTVIVNNTFIQHYNYHPAGVVLAGHTTAVWRHDSVHRLGVAYPNRVVARQYHPTFYAAHPHPNVAQVQTQFHAATQRSVTVRSYSTADHFGHRDIAASGYNRNHSAFGGVAAGAQTRVYSNRGYSSLSHAGGAMGHPMSSGGPGHMLGGGGHVGDGGQGHGGEGHGGGHGNR